MSASITAPRGLQTLNPSPEISRYYNKVDAPYINTAQVLSEVLLPVRYPGQTFLVVDEEWWFKSGKLDADLVLKQDSGTGELISKFTSTVIPTVDDSTIVIPANNTWLFDSVPYTNTVTNVLPFDYAYEGFSYFLTIVATKFNTFVAKVGSQSISNPDEPIIDEENELFLTTYLIYDNYIDVVVPPVSPNIYVEKESFAPLTLISSGHVASIEIDKRNNIIFSGNITKTGNVIKNNSNHFVIGLPFTTTNKTANPIEIQHLNTSGGSGSIAYFNPEELSYFLQPNEVAIWISEILNGQKIHRRVSSYIDRDNVIYRSGTEVGKPMNGTFEIADELEVGFKQIVQDDSIENVMQFNKDEGIFYQSYLYDNLTDKNVQNRSNISVSPLSTSLQSADEITGYATNFSVQADKVIIQATDPLSKGFVGTDLYDKQDDLNAFAQLGDLTPLENDIFELQMNKANQDTTYTKTEVDAKVASVYKIRGSVANFASLPSSGQVSGDVWNLLDNGDNYAWVLDLNNTGVAGWDKLSGSVDLTAYETKVVAESKYLQIVNASATVLATVLTGISFLTGGAIVSTDSVLVAFGKIQKNITDIFTALDLKQTKKAIITNATVSGTYNLDASLTDTYNLTLTGNTTLALINTSSNFAEPMTVYITGLYTLAYPAGATLIGEYLGNRKNQLVIEKIGSVIFITVNNYV